MSNGFSFFPFLILFIISTIIRRFFYDKKYSSVSAGSIVMAIGIFYLAVLPKLPFVNTFIKDVLALELFIIWFYIAISYINCYFNNINFTAVISHTKDYFSIGTWAAGCAVLVVVLSKEFPIWYIVITVITLLAVVIWLVYLSIITIYFWKILFERKHISATGIMLLPTVSTQSIVILIYTLLPVYRDNEIYKVLIIFGCLFYIIGLITILRDCIKIKFKRLLLSWSSTNSIIHGALSITGVASLITHAISDTFVIVIWIASSCLFVLIESLSIVKLYQRIKIAGLSSRSINYNISQWSRLFTYGMYYALTNAISETNLISNPLIYNVNQFGQYVILGLLLIETILFFNSKFNFFYGGIVSP